MRLPTQFNLIQLNLGKVELKSLNPDSLDSIPFLSVLHILSLVYMYVSFGMICPSDVN